MNKFMITFSLFTLSGSCIAQATSPSVPTAPVRTETSKTSAPSILSIPSTVEAAVKYDSENWISAYNAVATQGKNDIINRAIKQKAALDKLYNEKGYLDPAIAGAIYKAYDQLFTDVSTFLQDLPRVEEHSANRLNTIDDDIQKIAQMKPKPSVAFFPEKCSSYDAPTIQGRIEKRPVTSSLAFVVYNASGKKTYYDFVSGKNNPGPGTMGHGHEVHISTTPAHMVEQAQLGKIAGKTVVVCLGKPIVPSSSQNPTEPKNAPTK
jgi:hypothetical protein